MSKKQVQPLADFMRAKKRAACKVCQLPTDVQEQLRAARTAKIRRPDQIEWLRTEVGVDITSADLDSHYSARHEAA